MNDGAKLGGTFTIKCFDKDGSFKWEDTAHNLVMNVGLQHIMDVTFSNATGSDTWFVGLIGDTTTVAAGDTLASHGGWTEFTSYTEGARQEWVEVRSAQTMTNSASTADFTINADSSVIGGAFLADTTTGTSGILMCGAAFSGGDKNADSQDTIQVTYQFTAADDGS